MGKAFGTMSVKKINDRYRVLRRLGEGGMGKVYLAADELNNDQTVAVKVLKEGKVGRSRRNFLVNEFKFLRTLDHQNISKVYDFGFIEGRNSMFFTSEYVEGTDFYTFSQSHSIQEVFEITTQVCRALNYIHSRGIIHSDIKPSNILIAKTPQGYRAKLLDFGISSDTISADRKKIRGTPSYIAPELIAGQEIDHRIDLFSLGVTLYAIIYNKVPFEGEEKTDVFNAILYQEVTFGEETSYPKAFVEIIMRLLQKQPWNRYQTANDVIIEMNKKLGLSYKAETSETKRSYISRTKLFEREDVMTELSAVTDTLRDGKLAQSSNILIKGGKGVGKTRILDEIKSQAQVENIFTIHFDCGRHHSNFSLLHNLYAAMRGIDKNHIDIDDQFQRFEQTFSGDEDMEVQKIDLNMQKYGLFKAVSDYIIRCSLRRPILVLIDNFQSLDKSSLEFFSYLLAELKYLFGKVSPQIALLASFLTEGTHASTPECQKYFDGTLTLSNLRSKETLHEFIRSLLDIPKVSNAFASQLYDVTQGNPLLVSELLNLLADKGLIMFGGQREISDNINLNLLEAPSSLESIYFHQISHFSEDAKRLLRFLSCFSQGCPMEVLSNMVGDEIEMGEYYRLLREKVLVQHHQEQTVNFTNLGLKRALYQSIPERDRAGEHDRILDVMESVEDFERLRSEERLASAVVEELAYQARYGSLRKRAIDYNMMAARLSSREASLHQAIFYYETCLEFRESLDKNELYRIMWHLINLNSFIGNYELAISYCDQVREHNPETTAVGKEVSIKLANIYKDIGNYTASLKVLDDLEMSNAFDEFTPFDLCRIYNLRGTCLLARTQYDGATKYSNKALSIIGDQTEDQGMVRERLRALANIAQVNNFVGDYDRAIELLRQASDLSKSRIFAMERCQILSRMGYAYSVAGEVNESLTYYSKAYKIAQNIHSLRGQSILATNLANAYFKLGEIEKALNHFEEAHKAAMKMNSSSEQAFCQANLGNLYRLLGLERMAEEVLISTYVLAADKGWLNLENLACHYLVILFLGSGDFEKTHWWYESLKKSNEKVRKEKPESGGLMLNLVGMEILLKEGRFEDAKSYAQRVTEAVNDRNDTELLDRYYLNMGQIYYKSDREFTRANDAFEKSLKYYKLSKGESSNLEHMELRLNSHYQAARCSYKLGQVQEGLDHYKECLNIMNKMLARIPEQYQKSFLAYNKRDYIRNEAENEVFQSDEVTQPPVFLKDGDS